ncbi:MAG TPA: phosphate acetyltransferase [Polyangiaceae bacterium]|nr:phosphate acetyltransferase [Polyangiaceae bacterium]
MPHPIYLAPSGSQVGLTSVALGLVRSLDKRGMRVAFFKPIAQMERNQHERETGPERSTYFIRKTTSLQPTDPIPLETAERLLLAHRTDELLERVLRDYHVSARDADVVVIEGLVHSPNLPFEVELNLELIQALGADVVLVASQGQNTTADLDSLLELSAEQYGGEHGTRLVGCIVNRVPRNDSNTPEDYLRETYQRSQFIHSGKIRLLGAIPNEPDLSACRTVDVARHLGAEVLFEGELTKRRVKRFTLLARTVPNLLYDLIPGSIMVTPADRSDIILATALAALNKIPIAGLVLTGDMPLPEAVLKLCKPAIATGLPVLRVRTDSWQTSLSLFRMSSEVPVDDLERVQRSMDLIAEYVDPGLVTRRSAAPIEARLSPAAFCYRLTEWAKRAQARIVLPEGTEPRTLRAAVICAQRGIARPVLLGDPAEVRQVAEGLELELPTNLEILDPSKIRERYVDPLVEMRRTKGLLRGAAAELLEDNVWLGTVMLALGEVDGLVSGAVHSTANTLRPALQIIKTKPGARVVSSVFFMCMPEQVLVYGDCAVNPDPDAETLSDIAIQSAESALQFGLAARVAMISYSTGDSGSGSDVDKVRAATQLAKQRRPELEIDGPLQYDAAAIADVARQKAPTSPVAGRATVYVFPDLNTGNTTYKAVQRSAHVISIGPVLQGLNRPVNDLSRGALVEDIVYTIAITAIQANAETEALMAAAPKSASQ